MSSSGYKRVNLSHVSDVRTRSALGGLDESVQRLHAAVGAAIAVDSLGAASVTGHLVPRTLTGDPTAVPQRGKLGEIAAFDGGLYRKTAKDGTDTAWELLSGSGSSSGGSGGGGLTNHASRHLPGGADPLLTDTPIDVDLQGNYIGDAAMLARSDHRHKLDEDIAPDWTNAHRFLPTATIVPQTIIPAAGQTANLWELYADDEVTLRALWNPLGRLGIRDSDPTALLSIKGAVDVEAEVVTLGPVLWLDASNADLLNNATLADNDTVVEWKDRGSGAHNAPLSSGTPKLYTSAGGTDHPTSLPNGKPVVSLVVTSGAEWDAFVNITPGTTGPDYPRYAWNLGAFTMCAVMQTVAGAGGAIGTILGGDPIAYSGTNQGARIQLVDELGDYYLICRYMNVGGDNYYKAGPITFPDGDWMRITLVRSGATHTFYVNDAVVPTASTSGTLTSALPLVYLQAYAINPSYFASDSHLAELLLFSSALSGTDLDNVWSYLDNKYYDGTNYVAVPGGGVGSDPLVHWKDTAGVVRGAVTNAIDFGFGTDTPLARVHVADDGEQLRLSRQDDPTKLTAFTVDASGNLTIDPLGTLHVLAPFDIGATQQFAVNATGNITRINDIPTSWPAVQGAADRYLRNDGSGNLSWAQVNLATGTTGTLPIGSLPALSYSASVASATTWTITGATHGLGTADLTVAVYDSGSPTRTRITPGSVTINDSTFDVTITFAVAQAGRVVIQR